MRKVGKELTALVLLILVGLMGIVELILDLIYQCIRLLVNTYRCAMIKIIKNIKPTYQTGRGCLYSYLNGLERNLRFRNKFDEYMDERRRKGQ